MRDFEIERDIETILKRGWTRGFGERWQTDMNYLRALQTPVPQKNTTNYFSNEYNHKVAQKSEIVKENFWDDDERNDENTGKLQYFYERS